MPVATFACLACRRVSHNPVDAAEGYCGACRRYTGRCLMCGLVDAERIVLVNGNPYCVVHAGSAFREMRRVIDNVLATLATEISRAAPS